MFMVVCASARCGSKHMAQDSPWGVCVRQPFRSTRCISTCVQTNRAKILEDLSFASYAASSGHWLAVDTKVNDTLGAMPHLELPLVAV